jgi:hypothetical protein
VHDSELLATWCGEATHAEAVRVRLARVTTSTQPHTFTWWLLFVILLGQCGAKAGPRQGGSSRVVCHKRCQVRVGCEGGHQAVTQASPVRNSANRMLSAAAPNRATGGLLRQLLSLVCVCGTSSSWPYHTS